LNRRILLPAAVLAGLASGCGGGLVAVSGTVTLDGRPADDGSVSFQPADGQGPSAGGSVREGRFEVSPGLTPGTYKVAVRAGLKTGRKIPAGPPLPAGSTVDEMLSSPAPGQSPAPVLVEVKSGGPPLAFDLKSAPPAKK
jgi:hypothetical protein